MSDQDEARAPFGFDDGTPLVLAVAPDSPAAAAAAGLRVGDALLAVDGQPPPGPARRDSKSLTRVELILDELDRAAADQLLSLRVRRNQQVIVIDFAPATGCGSRFFATPSNSLDSSADSTYVQISTATITFAGTEEQVATVLAHELAHNILGGGQIRFLVPAARAMTSL